MMKLLTGKKFLLIVLVAIVAAGAWFMLSGSEPETLLTTGTGTTSAAEREILSTLLELRSLTLNGSILTDQAFLSLQDFGTEIVPEPIGRRNPFAPLGSNPATPAP